MNDRQPFVLLNPVVNDLPPADVALVTGALEALHAAELPEVFDALTQRVLGVTPDTEAGRLRDARLVTAAGDLQPFAELVLLDVAWVARVPGWSAPMRTARALEAIGLCGF